jgi:two-component system, LytTR family, response regulator
MYTSSLLLNIAIIGVNQPTLLVIKEHLERSFKNHNLAFTANSIESAKNLFLSHQPNLLILDIDNPNHKATFDFLEQQETFNFKIIFISEIIHQDFSRAFNDFPLINYLLKPIRSELLDRAIEKAIVQLEEQHILMKHAIGNSPQALASSLSEKTASKDKTITLPLTKGRSRIISQRDIIRCESMGDLCLIVLQRENEEEKLTLNMSLKNCLNLLDPTLFYRVHYQHIVNMNYVASVNQRQRLEVALSNGEKIPMARRRKSELLERYSAV